MSDSSSEKPSVLDEVRASLEGLKRTPDGAMLYRMIERGLARHDKSGGRMEDVYVRFLYTLLDRFAGENTGNPVTRVKARLIQQRLAPYVDLEKVKKQFKRPAPSFVSTQTKPRPESKTESKQESRPEFSAEPSPKKSVDTVLTPAKINLSEQHKSVPELVSEKETTPEAIDLQSLNDELVADNIKTRRDNIDEVEVPGDLDSLSLENIDEQISNIPEQGLVADGGESDLIQSGEIHEELELNISDTAARNKEFNKLLKANLKALEMTENAEDMMDLKELLIRGLQDLAQGQDELDTELTQTNNFIQEVKQDRQELKTRVEKLAKYGVTDELTGLPKREMLHKQLDAEVGRARRYGFSLALSILDIDNLKHINQQYGKEAGDEVLACYVREVLSKFRAYDFVARYGGDEFAIIFPNTSKDGAYRALEKARKCAADTVINYKGQSISLPGFSSVLTLYSQGEKPEVLLKRADEALSMAKLRGAGQILVSLPTPQ